MSTFTYNNLVPAAANNPSNDQPDMLINAASIASIVAVDHVGFNTAEGGTHNQSTYNRLGSKPTVTGTQVAVYGKASGGVTQLFYENSAGTEYQMTGSANSAANGYTYLFGGIIFKWGNTSVGPNTTATITFDTTVPFSAVRSITIGSVQATDGLDDQPYIKSVSTTNCVITNPSAQTWSVSIMAVGV